MEESWLRKTISKIENYPLFELYAYLHLAYIHILPFILVVHYNHVDPLLLIAVFMVFELFLFFPTIALICCSLIINFLCAISLPLLTYKFLMYGWPIEEISIGKCFLISILVTPIGIINLIANNLIIKKFDES